MVRTRGQGLDGEPGPGEQSHALQRPSTGTVLQVVLLQLGQRNEPLQHPLIADVHLQTGRGRRGMIVFNWIFNILGVKKKN